MKSVIRKRWLLRVYCWAQLVFRRTRYVDKLRGLAINIQPTSGVSSRCVIKIRRGGSIAIGRNCFVPDFAMILTHGGNILIGDNCSLNPFSIIYGHGGVRIGNGVRIAANTAIIPANRVSASEGLPLSHSGVTARGVEIGDGVWLGAGVRILDGVRIGRHAVVGAASVVTKAVAANSTVVGIPARSIERR